MPLYKLNVRMILPNGTEGLPGDLVQIAEDFAASIRKGRIELVPKAAPNPAKVESE